MMRRNLLLKILCFSIPACILLYLYYQIRIISFYKHYYKILGHNDPLICYSIDTVDSLPNIQDTEVIEDSSIFFVETSCNSFNNDQIVINPRQACAVESAAITNPDKNIYLLFASQGLLNDNGSESSKIGKELLTYPNIHLMHVNMNRMVKGTVLEDLWKKKKVLNGKYPLSHTSDIFRYLILWKYGGIYADLDVVVIKNLDELPENFAGAQDEVYLASGVMGFSKHGKGHEYVDSCLNDLAEHFNGDIWGANGPLIVTKLAQRLCKENKLKSFMGKSCKHFHLLSKNAFYPIFYTSWRLYFSPNHLSYVKNISKSSYMIHMWNKMSIDEKIDISQDEVPYMYFARKFCPRTVRSLEEYF